MENNVATTLGLIEDLLDEARGVETPAETRETADATTEREPALA